MSSVGVDTPSIAARFLGGGGSGGFSARGVIPDTNNDTIGRAAALTGAADSAHCIVSFWFFMEADFNTSLNVIFSFNNSNFGMGISGGSGYGLGATLFNHAGTVGIFPSTDDAAFTTGTYHHFLGIFDTNHDAGSKVLYMAVDGVDHYRGGDDTSDAFLMDFTDTDWEIWETGHIGTDQLALGELYVAPGQYLDPTDPATLLKFRTAGGLPADLGTDGSTPTGTRPAIYLRGPDFDVNLGTGGSFVDAGTQSDAGEIPDGSPAGDTNIGGFTDSSATAPTPALTLWTADFANGVYEMNGATTTVEAMFQEDTNYNDWNPATDVTPGQGIVSCGPCSTPALMNLMNGGGTFVIYGAYTSGFGFMSAMNFTDGFDVWDQECFIDISTTSVEGQLKVPAGTNDSVTAGAPPTDRPFKIAVTLRGNHVAFSVDGGEVSVVENIVGDWSDMTEWGFDCTRLLTSKIECLTWRDDADLPGLSA